MARAPIRVVSDLHMSAGRLDDFDPAIEACFLQFLDDFAKHSPAELVINGDFLDFVQAPPAWGSALEARAAGEIPLCYPLATALDKLDAIHGAHKDVFKALGAFVLASPENRIVILPGNHDADLFWDEVQGRIRDYLPPEASDRLTFHIDAVYQPAGSDVWIEHGHQYDPANRFYLGDAPIWSRDNRPILTDGLSTPRLYECPGTAALIRFLNRLDHDYPFIDNIKPFGTMWKLLPKLAASGPLRASLAVWRLGEFLASMKLTGPEGWLGTRELAEAPTERLREAMDRASPDGLLKLRAGLVAAGFESERPFDQILDRPKDVARLIASLTDNPELFDLLPEKRRSLLGDSGRAGMLSLKASYAADETADLIQRAGGILARSGVRAVIMGHTHDPVDPAPDRRYINTGSWTRNLRLPEDATPGWSILAEDSYVTFPYSLRYAEIPAEGEPRLHVFAERLA